MTVFLIPVKTYCCFRILNGDRFGFYRQWVVSPLTKWAPPPAGDYFKNSAVMERTGAAKVPLSMNKRWAYALILLLITGVVTISMLGLFGFEIETDGMAALEAKHLYRDVASGGLGMWLAYSVYIWTAVAFALAIASSVARDICKYLRQRMG